MIDILKTTLLSAEEICTRLNVSRSTFDRWRKINPLAESPFGKGGGFQTKVLANMRTPSDVMNDLLGLTTFPEPSLNVGGSPRWEADAVNAWLDENKDKRNRRGIRS